MTELMQASREWASRPADERYTSLTDMLADARLQRDRSNQLHLSNRKVHAVPVQGDPLHKGLAIETPDGATLPSHWSFGQIAGLAKAPAGYLRSLPAPVAADCINYGLRQRDIEDVKLLTRADFGDSPVTALAAATGPQYGRIWNSDIINALVERFGDGVTGPFKVPGEFGKPVPITKANTTLYKGDRDMFVFLADESRAFEIADRRNGEPGLMSRGFFVWNSEVGSATFGISTFLFDYVCMNRIVWGAQDVKEFRIRHTSGAPDKWLEEVQPALISYAESSASNIIDAIASAKARRLDDIDDFLLTRFNGGMAKGIKLAFDADEQRPIETVWDVVTGMTAYARGVAWQDDRVVLERLAGDLLKQAV